MRLRAVYFQVASEICEFVNANGIKHIVQIVYDGAAVKFPYVLFYWEAE